jgi:hypothetical protein
VTLSQGPVPASGVFPAGVLLHWTALEQRIRWVHWWAPEDLDPQRLAPVAASELVDLLVLLRPRLDQRVVDGPAAARPLPERFNRQGRGQGCLDGRPHAVRENSPNLPDEEDHWRGADR